MDQSRRAFIEQVAGASALTGLGGRQFGGAGGAGG